MDGRQLKGYLKDWAFNPMKAVRGELGGVPVATEGRRFLMSWHVEAVLSDEGVVCVCTSPEGYCGWSSKVKDAAQALGLPVLDLTWGELVELSDRALMHGTTADPIGRKLAQAAGGDSRVSATA